MCQEILGKPGVSAKGTPLVCKALANCTDATAHLSRVLDRIKQEGDPHGLVDKLRASTRVALYPFKRATVGEIRDQIEVYNAALRFAVDLLHLDSSTEQYRKLQEIDDKLVATRAALEQLPTISSIITVVKDQTETIRTDTSAIRHTQQSAEERETLREVMDWLCPADYSQQQNDFFARKTNDTCKWFLESSEFLALRKGQIHTLVCTGQPGAGKTYLASIAINELLHSEEISAVGIAYIFCNYKRRDEQDITHCVAALARQLLYRKGSVPPLLLGTYYQHKSRNSRPSPGELTEALASLAQAFTATYIVIDALDEGDKNVCADLLSILQRKQVGSHLRLMLTTRPLREILGSIENYQTLEVRASDTDVRLFLETQMKTLIVRVDTELQERIICAIVSAVDGMFMLAKLHMESLSQHAKIPVLRKALAELPKGSDPSVYARLYSNAMDRICGQGDQRAGLAKEALSWVVFAKRPLTALELRHALALDLDADMDDLVEDDLDDLDSVLRLCAGLIVEDEQSHTVRLVHYTAQKFFEDNCKTWLPSAESAIALRCLKYLSLKSFTQGSCHDSSGRGYWLRCRSYPLLQYCAHYWGKHLLASAENDDVCEYSSVQDVAVRFLQEASLMQAAAQAMDVTKETLFNHYPDDTWGWHLIGRLGLCVLVPAFLKVDPMVNCQDSFGMTPLSYAAQYGHEDVVTQLLNTGQAHLNATDENGRTALTFAAEGGYDAIAALLLATEKVDVGAVDAIGRTALSYAAQGGYETILRSLLYTDGSHADLADEEGRTPLSYAAEEGRESAVSLLLELSEADVNFEDHSYQTPLSYAVHEAHEAVVRVLLATGRVDASLTSDYTGWLFKIANGRHESIIKLLLDDGYIKVDCPDEWRSRTPLSLAAARSGQIVKLLLGYDEVVVDSKDDDGRTPLSHAAGGYNITALELLLGTKRVDVNSVDNQGRTPLSRAIERAIESFCFADRIDGHGWDAMDMLIRTGQLDVKPKDIFARIPSCLEGHVREETAKFAERMQEAIAEAIMAITRSLQLGYEHDPKHGNLEDFQVKMTVDVVVALRNWGRFHNMVTKAFDAARHERPVGAEGLPPLSNAHLDAESIPRYAADSSTIPPIDDDNRDAVTVGLLKSTSAVEAAWKVPQVDKGTSGDERRNEYG